MTIKKVIGTAPSQVPRNKDLGTMAYQDANAVAIGQTTITGNSSANSLTVKTNHTGNPTALYISGTDLINGVSLDAQAFTVLNVGKDSGSNRSAWFQGNVSFPNGYGINFGATTGSGVSSSLLNDYEEGTWTPVLSGSTGNPTVTYSTSTGTYVKIGSTVFVTADCRWTAISGGSGNLYMNLPFVSATNYSTGIVGEKNGANVAAGSNLTFENNGGTASMVFLDNLPTGGTQGYGVSGLGSNGYLIFSFTYRAAS